ncbi:ThiF family adenylyltransferase [Leeuwenhoekiella polynyae]|uniref:Molybdopterin-synthase adenylyltransferase n=1 Tax=Leeuwenhoekiella polynyae TaxID=1550906 RepID=A0A4Q0P6J2_9FLAO|nr:HesA/MoeB/ThiF family protein [Leeuwenhoekiella polynyae]RXG22260.1 adenylyltransferase/sulfurtransferase [Leeuwenhoekiella polynyae]
MSRYQRQIILPQIGEKGQQKLTEARVLVIGAGGLGCALLPYLVASGIGNLGIVDGDRVEESNLHRQILFSNNSIGKFKAEEAQVFLNNQNPACSITVYTEYLTAENALQLFEKYDIIVDATDRIAIRYLINDAAVLTGKPFVYGSIHRFEGQVSVFNYSNGPTYRCLFPKAIEVPSCAEAGVLGTSVGLIGMMQAQEVLKIILGSENVLSGELLIYNTLTASQHKFQFSKNEQIEITHEFFDTEYTSEKIEPESFHPSLLEKYTLIDVRELNEHPRIQHQNILELPLSNFKETLNQLDKEQAYLVFCKSGIRAAKAETILQEHNFKNTRALQESASQLEVLITNASVLKQ